MHTPHTTAPLAHSFRMLIYFILLLQFSLLSLLFTPLPYPIITPPLPLTPTPTPTIISHSPLHSLTYICPTPQHLNPLLSFFPPLSLRRRHPPHSSRAEHSLPQLSLSSSRGGCGGCGLDFLLRLLQHPDRCKSHNIAVCDSTQHSIA